MNTHSCPLFPEGCIASTVSSPNQHLLRTDDVISCCLDLSAPSISFRINGQPVQGMFENFNIDGLFFPVVSFSAGIKLVFLCFWPVSCPTYTSTVTALPSLLPCHSHLGSPGHQPVPYRKGQGSPLRGISGGWGCVHMSIPPLTPLASALKHSKFI